MRTYVTEHLPTLPETAIPGHGAELGETENRMFGEIVARLEDLDHTAPELIREISAATGPAKTADPQEPEGLGTAVPMPRLRG